MNVTVVFAPAGVLATALTPGGLNIEDAVRLSIHWATGSKCAEFGKLPDTPSVSEPMAPGTGAVPADSWQSPSRSCWRLLRAAGCPTGAGEGVDAQAGRDPAAELRRPPPTSRPPCRRVCVTWPLATRSSLLMATTLS